MILTPAKNKMLHENIIAIALVPCHPFSSLFNFDYLAKVVGLNPRSTGKKTSSLSMQYSS
jgi:hypothetical protein